MRVNFIVNGRPVAVDVDPMRRLLDVIREDLGLTGTKEGCGEGECGACSVLIDGKLANSCLVPIAQVAGGDVTTIEGVREGAIGSVITEAFAETHAVQCGFCTPGMVVAAAAFLGGRGTERDGAVVGDYAVAGDAEARETAGPSEPSEAEVRHALSGNICRCTGYDMIVDGVLEAARRLHAAGTVAGHVPPRPDAPEERSQ